MIFDSNKSSPLAARVFEFRRQDGGGDPQHLAAVIEIALRRRRFQQLLTLPGQRTGGGVQFRAFEILGGVFQQGYLTHREERKEVFKTNRETPKNHFLIGAPNLPSTGGVQDQQITRQ